MFKKRKNSMKFVNDAVASSKGIPMSEEENIKPFSSKLKSLFKKKEKGLKARKGTNAFYRDL